MKGIFRILAAMLVIALPHQSRADDITAQCHDRAAIERIYHGHRTGTKQPFEEAVPRELLEQIVRQDQRKEAALQNVYGVEITPAMVAAEVLRINTTTRAPEVLAEIKHALGDDAARFASAMARPILVERELRRRFDNDDKLHAAQRQQADAARASMLAKETVADLKEVTWQLAPRAADRNVVRDSNGGISGLGAGGATLESQATSPTQGKNTSKAYSNEATAQVAQALTPPAKSVAGNDDLYFEDLDPELQKLLRVQLQKPGDVSAVIETPGGFLVFQAVETNAKTLVAASLTLLKRSYEDWLAQQTEAISSKSTGR